VNCDITLSHVSCDVGLPLFLRRALAGLTPTFPLLVIGFSGSDLQFAEDYLPLLRSDRRVVWVAHPGAPLASWLRARLDSLGAQIVEATLQAVLAQLDVNVSPGAPDASAEAAARERLRRPIAEWARGSAVGGWKCAAFCADLLTVLDPAIEGRRALACTPPTVWRGALRKSTGRRPCFIAHCSAAALITFATVVPAFALPFTATHTFTGSPGNQASEPVDINPLGATLSDITRGPGVNANAGMHSINSNDWTTGATPDLPNDYYEFTITPLAGYELDVTDFPFTSRRSGTGPPNVEVRSSLETIGTIRAVFGRSVVTAPAPPTWHSGWLHLDRGANCGYEASGTGIRRRALTSSGTPTRKPASPIHQVA